MFPPTMAEILGLAPGHSSSRDGSMHLRHREAGFLGSNATVAGGVLLHCRWSTKAVRRSRTFSQAT